MSHELRTPLNAIIGFSEMIEQETMLMIDAARRKEYAQLINDSGQHLLSVVNGILDMSKMETGNFEISPEPFAPAPGDRQLLRSAGAEGAGVRHRALVTRLPPDLPDITGDKRAFKQILLNLMSNAVKFTERGGRVTVPPRSKPPIVLIGRRHRRRHQRRRSAAVGRPFFQARGAYDRRHDGTGLGLSIVKGLVAARR
jgi:cell cycle sensor histidine kinase DivJ